VRSAFVLLLLFATLVDGFGLSAVLGAFVAGIVLHSANRSAPARVQERYVAKLNAIGFGFVIPVFFITTGAQLDIRDVVRNGHTLALVPLFLVGMVLSRGVTSGLILRRGTTVRGAVALGSFQATSLTFPIIVTAIGIDLHFMTRSTAAALVTAGLLSVMLLPALALAMRPWDDDTVAADRSDQARPGG
jgi:Kef-type K+ transport system membrane component KefB